jgi:hypothetical protein
MICMHSEPSTRGRSYPSKRRLSEHQRLSVDRYNEPHGGEKVLAFSTPIIYIGPA